MERTVRAKFKVTEIRSTEHGHYTTNAETGRSEFAGMFEKRTILMSPVYGNNDPNHENTKFWEASPSGHLELGTINPQAWKHFVLGKEYYLDFTLSPQEG